MNKRLKKLLMASMATLMLASVGAGASSVKATSVHASRISRLIAKRNKDFREAKYYKARVINNEINRLSPHNRNSHHFYKIKNLRHVRMNFHHASKAYQHGYMDGFCDIGKASYFFTRKYRNNKQYKRGFINGMAKSSSSRKEAKYYYKIFRATDAKPASKKLFNLRYTNYYRERAGLKDI